MNRRKLLTAIMVVTWGIFSFNVVSAQTDSKTTDSKTVSTSKTAPSKATPAKPAVPASNTKKIVLSKPTASSAKQGATPAKPAVPASATKKDGTPAKPGLGSAKTAIAKDLTGYWLTAQKGSIVEFYKTGDTYEGKVAWSKNAKDKNGKPLKDVNNPNKAKKNNAIVGTTMLSGLKYNAATDTYEGGKIYQYQTGRSYNCKVTLNKEKNVMKIVGGVGFISKTLTWTRTTGIPGK